MRRIDHRRRVISDIERMRGIADHMDRVIGLIDEAIRQIGVAREALETIQAWCDDIPKDEPTMRRKIAARCADALRLMEPK